MKRTAHKVLSQGAAPGFAYDSSISPFAAAARVIPGAERFPHVIEEFLLRSGSGRVGITEHDVGKLVLMLY